MHKYFIFVFLLFISFSSHAGKNDAFIGVSATQGVSVEDHGISYKSLGLFYLSRGGKFHFGVDRFVWESDCADLYRINIQKRNRANLRGLFYFYGAETFAWINTNPECNQVNLTPNALPFFGAGVYLTRKKLLSEISVTAHMLRLEATIKVGF